MQTLTKTEIEILRALMKGLSAKEIASVMFRSVHTVFTHIKNIKAKLGAKSIAQAVVKYLATIDNPKLILKALLFVMIQLHIVIGSSNNDLRRSRKPRIVKITRNDSIRYRS